MPQRDGELQGGTLSPGSPHVPVFPRALSRWPWGTPGRAGEPRPATPPGLTHPGEGCEAQVNKSVCLQKGLLCAPDNSPL